MRKQEPKRMAYHCNSCHHLSLPARQLQAPRHAAIATATATFSPIGRLCHQNATTVTLQRLPPTACLSTEPILQHHYCPPPPAYAVTPACQMPRRHWGGGRRGGISLPSPRLHRHGRSGAHGGVVQIASVPQHPMRGRVSWHPRSHTGARSCMPRGSRK